jgi:hypothetical protein
LNLHHRENLKSRFELQTGFRFSDFTLFQINAAWRVTANRDTNGPRRLSTDNDYEEEEEEEEEEELQCQNVPLNLGA